MKAFGLFVFATAAMLAAPASAGQNVWKSSMDFHCAQSGGNKLVVPTGKVARDFSLHGLESGTNCTVGGAIDFKNFSIQHDWFDDRMKLHQDIVYSYDFRQGRTVEMMNGQTFAPTNGPDPVMLKNLQLGPGDYYLGVGGGSGANVMLMYDMTP